MDIKGRGGFVIAPPTVRPRSQTHPGGAYRFEVGGLAQLAELPKLPDDWRSRLERLSGRAEAKPIQGDAPASTQAGGIVVKGTRNDSLFRAGLRFAPQVDDRCLHDALTAY